MQRGQYTTCGIFFVLLTSACALPLDNLRKYQTNTIENSPAIAREKQIQQIAPNLYKVPTNAVLIWDALIPILIQNYNFSLANKELGIISTEWDSYYLQSDIYRNRISLHLRSLSNEESTLALRNNVEILSKEGSAHAQSFWMPAPSNNSEVERILTNLGSMLNLKSIPQSIPNSSVSAVDSSRDDLAQRGLDFRP